MRNAVSPRMRQRVVPSALFRALPSGAADALLLSGSGEERLIRLAKNMLPGPVEQMRLAVDMLCAAWEGSLLSARAASLLRQAHPCLSGEAAAFCRTVAAMRPGNPEEAERVSSLIRKGDPQGAMRLVSRCSAGEPGNMFWLYFATFFGLHLGELDWYEPYLSAFVLPDSFALAFRADYLFARGDMAKAADCYAAAFAGAGLTEWLAREGECRRALGQREAAGRLWRKAVILRPWQINLRLRLNDLERGADLPGGPPPGRGEILLYSWNHAPDLDKALAALADSRLASCALTVLDNGSSDATAQVLHAWQERFGERLRRISLPTNVGAPAARNWLLALESSGTADWVVFLDDDALVPPDWLGLFGTAKRLYPEADIIGCRVTDVASPLHIQCVDLHIEVIAGETESRIAFVNEPVDEPDFGQHSYLRPAAHVTGCCHLLTRRSIDAVGNFDLRFSPSQLDDVERDLRSCVNGSCPLYQGHLRVRHLKRTGLTAKTSPWQQANLVGNRAKLSGSYDVESLRAIADFDLRSSLAVLNSDEQDG